MPEKNCEKKRTNDPDALTGDPPHCFPNENDKTQAIDGCPKKTSTPSCTKIRNPKLQPVDPIHCVPSVNDK